MARFTKDDIEFHTKGYGYGRFPAINVKVYSHYQDVQLPLALGCVADADGSNFRTIYTDDAFTHEWIEEHVYNDDAREDWAFYSACEQGFEYAQEAAEEIFDKYNVKVYSEGRSGGWLMVDGLPEDTDEWDAVLVAKWGKFARICKDIVSDIPRCIVEGIYINEFEQWQDEQEAAAKVAAFKAAIHAGGSFQ